MVSVFSFLPFLGALERGNVEMLHVSLGLGDLLGGPWVVVSRVSIGICIVIRYKC